MKAGKLDLYIQKGEEFKKTLTFTDDSVIPVPLDLTSCTVVATLRKTPSSLDGYNFTCEITDAVNGQVDLIFQFALSSTVDLPEESGQEKKEFLFSWDLYIIDSLGKPKRYIEGIVTITANNTKTV